MKIILASFPKNGTKSMNEAFQTLGYNVYDWFEHFWYHGNDWAKILDEGGSIEDFRRMYEDIDVVTDTPACLFWQQILEAFPNAKVIISTRNEEKWFLSFQNQLNATSSSFKLNLIQSFSYSEILSCGSSKMLPWQKWDTSPTVMKNLYRQHNFYVTQKVPADQLLVFDLKDGWAPLCKFLCKEIPDKPFPFNNKSASLFSDAVSHHPVMRKMVKETIFIVGTLTVLGIYCGYKILKKF
ncbi:uncharacterized protein LOC144749616 [Ciona intestinalis]